MLITSPSFAQEKMAMNMAVISAGAAPAGCTTSNDSALFDKTGLTGYNDPQSQRWLATKVTLAASTTITEYHAVTCGVAEVTYEMNLMADDGGSPSKPTGGAISGSSKAGVTLPECGSRADAAFTLASPKSGVTATAYWIVLTNNTGGYNTLDYTSDSGGRFCTSSNGTDWTCYDNLSFKVGLMGCQP